MCNMRLTFCWGSRNLASEPNGLHIHTCCLICVHHISQSRHELYSNSTAVVSVSLS